MKIIINKENIIETIKRAAKLAQGKSIIPVLNHIAFKLESGYLTVTACDSTCSYSETIQSEGDDGSFTIEAQKLLKSISAMKQGQIDISKGLIKQGKTKIKLESLDYDSYPVPELGKVSKCGINSNDLFFAVDQVSHAMSFKDVRIMLRGIHLTKGHAIATDGLRMATCEVPYDGVDVIVPSDTVKNMPDLTGEVFTSINHLVIRGDNFEFSTNLIDAKFPDWKRIIPGSSDVSLTVSKSDFLAAIKLASIGGDVITLEIEKSKALISSNDASTEIDVISTGDIKIGFMNNLLLDAVNKCDDEIAMSFATGKACTINGQFYVMPVRL